MHTIETSGGHMIRHQGSRSTARRIARRQLPELTSKAGGICPACRNPMVAACTIPVKDRIVIQGGVVVFWQNGQPKAVRQATTDHIVPLAQGGSNDHSNLQAMCAKCNSKKGDK